MAGLNQTAFQTRKVKLNPKPFWVWNYEFNQTWNPVGFGVSNGGWNQTRKAFGFQRGGLNQTRNSIGCKKIISHNSGLIYTIANKNMKLNQITANSRMFQKQEYYSWKNQNTLSFARSSARSSLSFCCARVRGSRSGGGLSCTAHGV